MVSIYGTVKKYGKSLGLASIAGAGGLILARPLIGFGQKIYNGQGVLTAADGQLMESYGIFNGQIVNKTQFRNAAIGTAVGVGMIAGATWLAKGGR